MSECTNPEYYSAQNCNYSINNKFTLKRHSTDECCCTDNKQNIKNIIRLITKEDNEDLEQEVYVKIWKNSDKYKEWHDSYG